MLDRLDVGSPRRQHNRKLSLVSRVRLSPLGLLVTVALLVYAPSVWAQGVEDIDAPIGRFVADLHGVVAPWGQNLDLAIGSGVRPLHPAAPWIGYWRRSARLPAPMEVRYRGSRCKCSVCVGKF